MKYIDINNDDKPSAVWKARSDQADLEWNNEAHPPHLIYQLDCQELITLRVVEIHRVRNPGELSSLFTFTCRLCL